MPVKFNEITTLKELYDYVSAASAIAGTKCPSVVSRYDGLADWIKEYVNEELQGNWNETGGRLKEFKQEVFYIREEWAKDGCPPMKMAVQSKPAGSFQPPPASSNGNGGAPPLVKAGFPWWIVLVLGGGALAYYLLSKKPGSSLSRGSHLVRKAKKRRTRR